MQKPNLNKIITNNLDKTSHISKIGEASLPTDNWLDQYKKGGGYFPEYHSFAPPRMNNGGGLLSRTVTCSNCGWSWKAVDGGKDVMTCHKCGGMIKMKKGGVTTQTTMPPATQDSVRHLAGQMMDYEARKGSPSGGGLSDWGYHSSQLPYNKVSSNWHAPQTKEQAVNMYMQEIGNNPTLGYFNSAMEKGEAGDFLYNTGRDPRVYMLDQYLKSTGQAGLPNRGSYNVDTKTAQWTPELQGSLDQQWNQYSGQINKLPTNTRRQLLNKGRDFYYQNINKQPNGSPNPSYEATWKPRIWESVNTYKKNGGDISIPDLDSDSWLLKYQKGGHVGGYCTPQPVTEYSKNSKGSMTVGEGIQPGSNRTLSFKEGVPSNVYDRYNQLVTQYPKIDKKALQLVVNDSLRMQGSMGAGSQYYKDGKLVEVNGFKPSAGDMGESIHRNMRVFGQQPSMDRVISAFPTTKELSNYLNSGYGFEYPQKKQGGVIKDDMGQWAHPGQITEIQGNNMATHGYGDIPLYVVPNKGTPRMVYPNTGNHTFPGASKFTEYPMMQGGGQLPKAQNGRRSPIITNNPNDPRLRAYLDSLWAYKHPGFEPNIPINDNNRPRKKFFSEHPGIFDLKPESYKYMGSNPTGPDIIHYEDIYKNNKFVSSKYLGVTKAELKDSYQTQFKKPVQPIVYQKKPEVKRLKDLNVQTNNNLDGVTGYTEFTNNKPQINVGQAASRPLPYRVEYRDEQGNPVHRNFENVQQGDEFQPGGERTGYYEFKKGGELPKAQNGVTTTSPIMVPSIINPIMKGINSISNWFSEGNEEPKVKINEPEKTLHIKLNDPRKIRMTTGSKINPNKDLVGGNYTLNDVQKMIKEAKKRGLSLDDVYNLSAIDLQETGWGNTDSVMGHALNYKGKDPIDKFLNAYNDKIKIADRLKYKDPYLKLQVYNGLGKIYPTTEEEYHGYKANSFYGVPVSKTGIDLKKNPLYGKQIIDLKNNVLKQNPEFVKFITETYNFKKFGGQTTWTDKYK